MDEIVRGYEYEKGKYIVLKEEDFGKPATAGGKNIEILDFVDLTEIDQFITKRLITSPPGTGAPESMNC